MKRKEKTLFKRREHSPAKPSHELPLLSLDEIVGLDRYQFERRARARAASAYLGDGVVLCRVMGRYKLYVSGRDVGFGAHVVMDGIWEPWIPAFMGRRIKPGMHVADVGANHGYYTLLMAELVGPAGRVLAVEPHPDTCQLLRKSIDVNGYAGRTDVVECAVGEFAGETLTLFVPENEPKNAHVLREAREGALSIKSERLGDLLAGWPKIDFIKMDVEGAEEAALSGAAQLIERDRPKLLLEYNIHRCRNPEGLLSWLIALYGDLEELDLTGALRQVSRSDLLDRDHTEDWMLYCSC